MKDNLDGFQKSRHDGRSRSRLVSTVKTPRLKNYFLSYPNVGSFIDVASRIDSE
jgi:hypothetical protein